MNETALTYLPSEVGGAQLLSGPQICQFLKISKSKLYDLMRDKKNPIPSVKMGSSRRFPLDKIRWWMENLGQ